MTILEQPIYFYDIYLYLMKKIEDFVFSRFFITSNIDIMIY